MLLQRIADNNVFGSLRDMQRIQQQLNRMLSVGEPNQEFPPIDVWASENGAIVQAEIPGIDSKDVEISLVNDTLTLRGSRNPDTLKDGETCHRQERGYGQFTRTIQLPFNIEADHVQARFTNGILEVTLPRAEADKPRKISVKCE